MSSKNLSIVPSSTKIGLKSKNIEPKILDEDAHIENIEKIIVRDYFPDLPKLKQKLGSDTDTPSLCPTPSQFGTPDSSISASRGGRGQPQEGVASDGVLGIIPKVTDAELEKLSLDCYLNKYTSEDNVSFNEIMEDAQAKHEAKHAWLYKNDQLQIEDDPERKGPRMWNYVAKNSLMYVPGGVELSAAEKLEKGAQKKQEICHSNTRFTIQPFSQPTESQKLAHNRLEGRIGLDGKEILPSRTPTLGGYKFMGTPSPAPGVDASPFMTWGEVEGTPYKLDGSDTPRIGTPSSGSVFRIPEVPKRDRLLHQLTDKVNKSHRAKKEEALRQATATFANSPRSLMSRTERLQSMSPAAQRLVSSKLGLHSNSPFSGSSTPTPERTPSNISTPKSSPKVSQSPFKRKSSSLLTDGLLKLPVKKVKASDFF